MADRLRKALIPNPFYVALLGASTAFVVTALGYLVSPYALEGPGARAGRQAPAAWLDRHGPMALGVEFVVMLVCALLAMATDRWFPSRPPRRDPRIVSERPTDGDQGR